MTVAILVPSLHRPHRIRPLLDQLDETTGDVDWTPYFVVSDDDEESQRILLDERVAFWTDNDQRWPTRIQFLYEHTSEPWMFFGSDDHQPHGGWLVAGLAEDADVVTFDDLFHPKGEGFLVRRAYLDDMGGTIDCGLGVVFHPGYVHNFADDEFASTARHRGVFAKTAGVVEHLHPAAGKADYDPTYEKAARHWSADETLWRTRRHLWGYNDWGGQ